MNLKVVFSIDATGFEKDITEDITIPSGYCVYCLHDKHNRLNQEIKKALERKGYDLRYYFQLMKAYIV